MGALQLECVYACHLLSCSFYWLVIFAVLFPVQDVLEDVLDLDVSVSSTEDFLQLVSGTKIMLGSLPLAHRYGGHQVSNNICSPTSTFITNGLFYFKHCVLPPFLLLIPFHLLQNCCLVFQGQASVGFPVVLPTISISTSDSAGGTLENI